MCAVCKYAHLQTIASNDFFHLLIQFWTIFYQILLFYTMFVFLGN